MKFLKLFEGYQSESEVAEICDKYEIENWSINSEGLVDVQGDVFLRDIKNIPLKFGEVSGYFDCSHRHSRKRRIIRSKIDQPSSSRITLSSLDGSPHTVGGGFVCSNAGLKSLKGGPNKVGGDFYCGWNNLTSLEFCPSSVGTNFYCGWNKIREFTGLKYIGGDFYCTGNPIEKIWDIISPDWKWDEDLMEFFEDCSIIHDDGESVAIDRLNFFLEEIGLKPVEKVKVYKKI
jgi:hypothetical protein